MGTVAVPSEFFRGELRVYGDWRTAFARELLQNATDARPNRIDVTFDDSGDRGRVVFTDDGIGMSRQVLEEVFFALGRTTKTDGGSIGGFGRARIIICFAQHSYEIRTGNLLVTGRGGEYEITEVDPADFVTGCRFTIDLLDPDTDRVRSAFERLLDTCALDVPVYLDGERVTGHRLPARANRVLRDENGQTWGRVYAEPGWGRVLVRVHGLTMFSRYSNGNDNVVLELDPRHARRVLAASRDTLHTTFAETLDRFLSDLTQNRRRALQPPAAPLSVQVHAGGFLASDARRTTPTDLDTPTAGVVAGTSGPGSSGGSAVVGSDAGTSPGGAGGATALVPVRPANAAAEANMRAAAYAPPPAGMPVRPAGEVAGLGFDVFLLADANDSRVRKLTRAWNPSGWDARTGVRRRSLLLTWKAAVGYCLDVLLDTHPDLGQVLWTVGWTFDEGVEALHKSHGDGHVFALNPVNSDGVRRWATGTRTDRAKLLAVAAHEVCHVLHGDHDERFAALLTDLYGNLDPVAADRAMRNPR